MRKLCAIWNIIKADKWAVFTYENATEDPEYITAPYFRWNISCKDGTFFGYINQVLKSIKVDGLVDKRGIPQV